jgi:hypothetical protein
MGVGVLSVRHAQGAAELHIELVLPTHERELRENVLRLLDAFEESYAFTVTVSPALLYDDDLADA